MKFRNAYETHNYWNVLHARETTKEMKFLKSEERALNDILLLTFLLFLFRLSNQIHQNCPRKIVTFCCRALNNNNNFVTQHPVKTCDIP